MIRLLVLALDGCGGTPGAPPLANARPAAKQRVCLPSPSAASLQSDDPARPEAYNSNNHLGWVDGQLVICQRTKAKAAVGCWRVDPASGDLTRIERTRLPGLGAWHAGGCFQTMCWGPPHDDTPTFLAENPDQRRIAVNDGGELAVYDIVLHRELARFGLGLDADMWFVGDTIYTRSNDAGPGSQLHVVTLAGQEIAAYGGIYYGGVASHGDQLWVHEWDDGAVVLTVLDRNGQPAAKLRAPPTELDGAEIVPHGDGFIALRYGQLLALDRGLQVTRKIAVLRCPPASDEPAE